MLAFDEERHRTDKEKVERGEIKRLRRYYLCECMKCGNIVSVRGENLVSGNTKGCGCDRDEKISTKLHNNSLNRYEYNQDLNCWMGYANNTGNAFFFNKDDYELICNHCWYENNDGRIMTRLSKDKLIFIHRLILFGEHDGNTGVLVDHINRNPLDNRRSNLRTCNAEENARNVTVQEGTYSGVLGVSWYEPGKKWRAYICPNRKFISLGYYDNIEDAIAARRAAEERYWGEFAPH